MIAPAWAAAFASPPAAMALAMIAAGASGGETTAPATTSQLRRDSSLLERKTTRLHTFSSFQKPLEVPNRAPSLPRTRLLQKQLPWQLHVIWSVMQRLVQEGVLVLWPWPHQHRGGIPVTGNV